MQSSCDLDAIVQPHPQDCGEQLLPQGGDFQPHPPSGEPPSRKRSGDVRTRSADHTRPGPTADKNIRTGSGDVRVRSHDHTVSHDTINQSVSPQTATLIEQQVMSRNSCSEMQSHLTSQCESHDQTTPTVTAGKFNWEKQVTPVLNAINSISKSDTESLCELCTNLWTVLQLSNMIGRSGKKKQRSSVLRTMFQLLDSEDSRLLLRAAKIILAVSKQYIWNFIHFEYIVVYTGSCHLIGYF